MTYPQLIVPAELIEFSRMIVTAKDIGHEEFNTACELEGAEHSASINKSIKNNI